MKRNKKYKIVVNNKIKAYGQSDTRTKLIEVNKKKHKGNKKELADTVLHEIKHLQHPKWSEKKVANSTPELENQSESLRQKMLAKLKDAQKTRNYKKGALKRKFHMKSDEKVVPGSFISKMNEMKQKRITSNNQSGSKARSIMNMM